MNAAPEILIIDDERQIRRLLTLTLQEAGYRTRESENGRLGIGEAAFRRPDVVILDLGLPDMHGLDVLKELREWTQVPVLVLTAKDREDDKIAALDAGADDYLTKPFGSGELLARLRVMLRRSAQGPEPTAFKLRNVSVDLTSRLVVKDGEEVHLTGKEYAILRLLLQHQGKVLTHRQLLREVWGPQNEEDTHYLRVHMTHLRQKLGDTDPENRMIRAESSLGYRIVPE
ncbi:response regulator [Akkermansia glycaniphila]|uniref:Transcriptional regulatory protein c terminal n=1 Tax=Akkermansia glycaniphila TaxID=1679444 RepID=A0A1C7PDZ8_9BACT|nr:response regulator [Akkermansia glycaniphila]MBT9450221.1 response regulator [Akkermansia glycaniphila]OCA03780.1 Fis family transcriptional regulator [Akkermansia glycaniphila]SEH95677.1 transcriptional regulatory protein c terminal [Akkermansia glycaniphila]